MILTICLVLDGGGCTEEISTTVRAELMFPTGQDPLTEAELLRVTVLGGDEEPESHVISRPTRGWSGLSTGLELGLVNLESAQILVEGIDLVGEVACAGRSIPLPLSSGMPGRVTVFVQTLGTSGLAPPLGAPVRDHGAAYLSGGGVFLAGGPADGRAWRDTWIYALDLYEPIRMISVPEPGRGLATVAQLGENRALIWGGSHPSDSAVLIDAVNDSIDLVDLDPEVHGAWPRPAWAAVFNGDVLALRGSTLVRFDVNGVAEIEGELEVDIEAVTLTVLSADLAVATTEGDLLVVGFDPGDASLVDLPQPEGAPRRGHVAAALSDGRFLLLGGETDQGLVERLELLDEDGASWSVSLEAELTGQGRLGATLTVLDDDRLVLAGGLDEAGRPWGNALVIDPDAGDVVVIDLAEPRAAHTATLLPTGTVLLAGGVGGDGENLDSVEILRPGPRAPE
jgi:hypothetical protein